MFSADFKNNLHCIDCSDGLHRNDCKFNSISSINIFMSLTGSKWHISKLLPCSGVVVEVAIRIKLHPLVPGVVQAVVDSRGDADLVAHRDGVTCCGLRECRRKKTAITHV